MTETLNEFRVSNDAMEDPEELRRRMDEEGYVFFRKLQDPAQLRALRLEILQVCRDGGWLENGTDVADGVVNLSSRCTEGDAAYTDVYHEVYKLQSFHRSGHWPVVLDMMEKVIGGTVLPHPQKIIRMWFPRYSEHTTPVHQDFVHFQGVFDTFTCWTPIGDCPIELGGLAVLPGSHKINYVRDHHFSLGAGSLAIDSDELTGEWVSTNYEIGDTLLFHSLTVHKALPNQSEDRLRVSLDNRYQSVDQPIAQHMLTPHLSNLCPLSWEEVYRDWPTDDLQYYWTDLDLQILPKDESWSQTGFQEALTLASQGDESAQYHLHRSIKRDPSSDRAKAAKEVLRDLKGAI